MKLRDEERRRHAEGMSAADALGLAASRGEGATLSELLARSHEALVSLQPTTLISHLLSRLGFGAC